MVKKRRRRNAFGNSVQFNRDVARARVLQQKTFVRQRFPSWKLFQLASECALPRTRLCLINFGPGSAPRFSPYCWRAKLRRDQQRELRQYRIDSNLLFIAQYLQDIASRALTVDEIKKMNRIEHIVVHGLCDDTFAGVHEIIQEFWKETKNSIRFYIISYLLDNSVILYLIT